MDSGVKKYLISETNTVREAMKIMNKTGEKELYIVSPKDELEGSITDGDIRRGILKGISIEDSAKKLMNNNPRFLFVEESLNIKKAKKIMMDFAIRTVPIVNEDNVIVNILNWIDIFSDVKKTEYEKRSNKVFILAGGIGSRLEPYTKILPKPLVPVGDIPILERIMDKFGNFGFSNFLISVNYKHEMIKLYFKDSEIMEKYDDIDYIKEDFPMGTIGSLTLARKLITEAFFITNSDILIEEDLHKIFDFHVKAESIMTIVACIKKSILPYGVIKTDNDGYLVEIEEKPVYQNIINTGIYVADPKIFDYLVKDVRTDINELIEKLLKNGEKVTVFPVLEDQWFDIGQLAEYERTRLFYEDNS